MNTWKGGISFIVSMGTLLHAQELPARLSDTPHSRDAFDQDGGRPENGGPTSQRMALPRGSVSAHTLSHRATKAAAKEFERGVQAWNKGQNTEAAQHLAEAVRLDPGFVEARSDLGIVYAKLGRAEEALNQYDRALALEPNLAMLESNKAAALVMLSRWEEGEQSARRALGLDPNSTDAHYMLGLALLMQNKITPETAAHLANAGDKYPRARLHLAAVRAALAASELVNGPDQIPKR